MANRQGSLTSVAGGSITLSSYFNSLSGSRIDNFTVDYLQAAWDLGPLFSNHLDVCAIGSLLLVSLVSLLKVKHTTALNNVLAVLNITLLAVISVSGLLLGNYANLTSEAYDKGFSGVLRGSSLVTYAFFGFESSTLAIEETVNPARNTPLSLFISLAIILALYCGSSLSLVLMTPFSQIDINAAYPTAFAGYGFLYFVVTIGPIVSLFGSLLTTIYYIVRYYNVLCFFFLFFSLSIYIVLSHLFFDK